MPSRASRAESHFERQLFIWAAGTITAAAVGYVVLGNYLPSFGWSRKIDKDVIPGLYNRYGNDCFANCVIQVIIAVFFVANLLTEFGWDTFFPGVPTGTG